jgi:hypothetical protein
LLKLLQENIAQKYIRCCVGNRSEKCSVQAPISFPEHARSQVKGGGHSSGAGSGEIELIQRWISNVSSTHARQLLQNINKVFRISRRKFDTFYTEIELKTTKN